MSAFNFTITDAGRAEIAQVGQLGPVMLSKIAIGSAGYIPTAAQTTLQAEIKQLAPGGSSVPTPGTIHITALDNSIDSYTIREVGLITTTGILFAIYSQSDDILVKVAGSVALLALDFVMTNVPPDSVTVGDARFQYPPATEAVQGVAEIATLDEVNAGLDDRTIVTPLKLANSKAVKNTITAERIADGAITATKIAPSSITSFQLSNTVKELIVPTGCVAAFAGVHSPPGWLKANGAAVMRRTYEALFAAIGTIYGTGDGSTTFNLPDLRGEFIRGWDGARGVDPGRSLGSSQMHELASHTHNFIHGPSSLPVHHHHGQPERILTEPTANNIQSHIGWIASAGGGETRPRNMALLYCIKY